MSNARSAWEQFKGNHQLKTDATPIDIDIKLPYIISQDDPIDWDQLARQHAHGLQQGTVTRERLASILELRSVMQICPTMEIHDLTKLPPEKVKHFLKINSHTWKEKITSQLDSLECFYSVITIPIENMSDSRLFNLFIFAHELGVIFIENFEAVKDHRLKFSNGIKTLKFLIPSVTARDKITKALFGENAKALIPKVGVITMDEIEESVRNHSRYAVFSYPGVADTTFFHDIDAPIFYMTLHDELHRRLTSSIPNQPLAAFYKAVDLVREKTGIHWSTDIWNAIDSEIGNFDAIEKRAAPVLMQETITKQFQTLLLARKFSNSEVMGLFSINNEELDTMLILSIDLRENEEKWQNLGIDKKYFTSEWIKKLLIFTERTYHLIKGLPSAEQVALLKQKWVTDDASLITPPPQCKYQVIDGYLQVTSEGKIIATASKAMSAATENLNAKIYLVNEAITARNQATHIKDKQPELCKQAKFIIELLAMIVKQGSKELVTVENVKFMGEVAEFTSYLLTDPTNDFARNHFSDLICANISLPQYLLAALKGFFSAVMDFVVSSHRYDNKIDHIKSRIRFFKEEYASSQEVYKLGVDYLNLARNIGELRK